MALLLPRLPWSARRRAIALAAGGLILTAITASTTAFWFRDVLLPPMLLLVGYWASGFLWVAPMPRYERLLARFDRALGLPSAPVRLPKALLDLLELAYVGVYPLIPIALALHLLYGIDPEPERFWTVILVTDFICFGMLPWIQTRPPRAVEDSEVVGSAVRNLNLTLLRHTSIGVNTVPSGHAAEALAVALLLADAPLPVALVLAAIAIAISAGAVVGRYHYALDAVAAWGVALLVWVTFG